MELHAFVVCVKVNIVVRFFVVSDCGHILSSFIGKGNIFSIGVIIIFFVCSVVGIFVTLMSHKFYTIGCCQAVHNFDVVVDEEVKSLGRGFDLVTFSIYICSTT